MWIHEHQNWSNFTWDSETLFCKLTDIRYRQGRLFGRMEGLGFEESFQLEQVAFLNPSN